MSETFIPAPHAETKRFPQSANLSHLGMIRFYSHSPGAAMLQIRTEGRISSYGKTKFQCYSGAILDVEEARTLRDALDSWIAEQS